MTTITAKHTKMEVLALKNLEFLQPMHIFLWVDWIII